MKNSTPLYWSYLIRGVAYFGCMVEKQKSESGFKFLNLRPNTFKVKTRNCWRRLDKEKIEKKEKNPLDIILIIWLNPHALFCCLFSPFCPFSFAFVAEWFHLIVNKTKTIGQIEKVWPARLLLLENICRYKGN